MDLCGDIISNRVQNGAKCTEEGEMNCRGEIMTGGEVASVFALSVAFLVLGVLVVGQAPIAQAIETGWGYSILQPVLNIVWRG